MTKLIRQINFPSDLRKFKKEQLKQISDELREELIDAVSETGGHLGAGLGVVELTVALHYVFDTPKDKLVWDVSHQSYPHKIITGRKDRIKTLRKGGGLSGFTKRSESEYDPFGAAHSSTSISSTLGMAVAKKLSNNNNNVVADSSDSSEDANNSIDTSNSESNISVAENSTTTNSQSNNSKQVSFSNNDILYYFQFGSSYINPNDRVLNKLADELKSNNSKIKLVGHTDSTGSEAVNLEISKSRAQAVFSFLVSKGVNRNLISVDGLNGFG